MQPVDCPFCKLPLERVIDQNQQALAFQDGFPVSEGHLLVIPRRHVESWFDLEPIELQACHELILKGKRVIEMKDPEVTGFNLGVNDGRSAGQTVFHGHMHLIPRREGDVENPRGGIRNIIPGKGDY